MAAPQSSRPNNDSPSDSSSVRPSFPYPPTVPAQRVQTTIHGQSNVNTYPSLIHNGNPSAERLHSAAAVLRGFSNPTIFAWLEHARSSLRSEQWFHPNPPSSQQHQAISALKDCSDNVVLTWLNFVRSPGVLDAGPNLHLNSNLSNERVAANSLGQPPCSLSDPLIQTTPRSPWGDDSSNVSRAASVREHSSPAATSNYHEHRCWVCNNTKAITTCDAFKKHVRTHTTQFSCVLCVGRSYPRRYILIQHLKMKHGIDDGSVLANQSKYTVHKKYFACGFCVSCFFSLNEQINHIDAAHYRYSEHIPDWDFDKVIQGLLSQPVVNEHWRSALTANQHPQESWSRCNPTQIQKLQLRLELSQEPADVLCKAAIAGLTGLEMVTSQSMQTILRQTAMSPLPSTSEQGFTTHAPWMTTPTLQSQDCDAIFEDPPLPQIASETNKSPAHAVYHHADHRSQPRSLLNNSESIMQQEYPSYMPSIASASGISQALGGRAGISHSSSLGGRSQGVSLNVATGPRSRQMAEAYDYPIQANMGWFPTLATQSAPLPSSHNRPLTSTYSPADHQNLDAHLFCQEKTEYPGIDMDVDSDNIQRFMHDQDHTRGQR